MIFWTHIYDLLMKVISLIATAAIVICIVQSLHLTRHVVGLIAASSVLVIGIPLYLFIFRTIGSLLYCRISLRAKFSFSEARQFDSVLAPMIPQLWCPLTEVREVAEQEKFAEALRRAEFWKQERVQFKLDRAVRLGEQTGTFRLVRGVLMALTFIGFAMGFFVIPPFDKLADFQASFGDDHKYSPMLNGILGGLLPGIILRILDARKGIHLHHVEKQ